MIPLPGGALHSTESSRGRLLLILCTKDAWCTLHPGFPAALAPVSTSTPHMGTSCAPVVPDGQRICTHLGGSFGLLSHLLRMKMTSGVHLRLAVKCTVLISPMHSHQQMFPLCPAIILLSPGCSGGLRDRAVHALLPPKSHLNNQEHSADSLHGQLFRSSLGSTQHAL